MGFFGKVFQRVQKPNMLLKSVYDTRKMYNDWLLPIQCLKQAVGVQMMMCEKSWQPDQFKGWMKIFKRIFKYNQKDNQIHQLEENKIIKYKTQTQKWVTPVQARASTTAVTSTTTVPPVTVTSSITSTDNCYYFYYNYNWIYYTVASIIFTIIFFVVLCVLCRRRRANGMLNQPMQPMVVNTTTMSSQPGYDSNRNMYNGQQNMAYQQGYNMQPGYNQNPNYQPSNQPHNPQQGYEMGEPVFLSNNNQPQKL